MSHTDARPAPADQRFVIVGTPTSVAGAVAHVRAAGVDPTAALGVFIVGARDPGAERALELPVLGGAEDLPRQHQRFGFQTAIVSLPAAMSSAMGRIGGLLRELGVTERFLPTIHDVLAGDAGRAQAMSLLPTDGDLMELVGRRPRAMDEALVRPVLTGRRVLVTGAGGSIGTELARICARFDPEVLILMERSDNALFEIDREIGARWPGVRRQAVLHDVVDAEGTLKRLTALRPDVVFHAAAHKHVPLMEDHPAAAVTNNLFGTKSIADAAMAVGAERFIMISTDKAVNPTSVMGATKRLAEVYIRSLNAPRPDAGGGRATRFGLVRFGNVLGSACSVLPIWARQITEGGPLTVTHPDMTRYFMTIPEAAALVIQAGAMAGRPDEGGNEVFVLDMGEPVRILDLARRFLISRGFEPVTDAAVDPGWTGSARPAMRVVFTGIRPGEKLYEELAYSAEELQPTRVQGVLSWSGQTPARAEVHQMIADLAGVRTSHDASKVIRTIQRHVPGMQRLSDVNNLSLTPPEAASSLNAA